MDRLTPWLTIIGLGEDGPDGLSLASCTALAGAEVVAGSPRHLALLEVPAARSLEWPVPFASGVEQVVALRGRPVVVLASGDPFWYGVGAVLAARLQPGEWRAHPGVSCFGLAAARLGWRIEDAACLGLHAAPLSRIRPHLSRGQRLIVLLRDAMAVQELAGLVTDLGFGDSPLWVMEALGGPRERLRQTRAGDPPFSDIATPVAVAIDVQGSGTVMPRVNGLPDRFFEHDGQITKRAVRALTLSSLAPRPGELLWDIGAGSGSISIEWLLAHQANRAIAIEADAERGARAQRNAAALGVDRLVLQSGIAPEALVNLPHPDAVFLGGGATQALLETLWQRLPAGTRLVGNAVTLEAEALFAAWQAGVGGSLLRIDLADATPLGTKRGWRSAMPVVQWSVTL